jgi:hypothetical protein
MAERAARISTVGPGAANPGTATHPEVQPVTTAIRKIDHMKSVFSSLALISML